MNKIWGELVSLAALGVLISSGSPPKTPKDNAPKAVASSAVTENKSATVRQQGSNTFESEVDVSKIDIRHPLAVWSIAQAFNPEVLEQRAKSHSDQANSSLQNIQTLRAMRELLIYLDNDRAFDEADENKDGLLSKDEINSAYINLRAKLAGKSSNSSEEISDGLVYDSPESLKRTDLDSRIKTTEGSIGACDYYAKIDSKTAELFERLAKVANLVDADSDGRLSWNELNILAVAGDGNVDNVTSDDVSYFEGLARKIDDDRKKKQSYKVSSPSSKQQTVNDRPSLWDNFIRLNHVGLPPE